MSSHRRPSRSEPARGAHGIDALTGHVTCDGVPELVEPPNARIGTPGSDHAADAAFDL